MLLDKYNEAVDNLINKVRTTQRENIIKAGELIADTVANGGNVYLSQVCHWIEWDLINRGGGPVFYRHFAWKMDVEKNGRKRDRSDVDDSTWGMAEYALKLSDMKPGDLLMVSSVSGRTKNVVDLAYEAKKMGIKVIAFTSMEYTMSVDPVHPSGKRLYEMVDIAMDNCAPAAEAMIDVPGIEAKYAAASGIACDILLWSMTTVAIEKLQEKGITPGILKSANFPGGTDYNNEKMYPQYDKYGW
ncbi:MAG: sugar isomerase domain-containing protein [Erysipelotrichaceae bacterium]|nr:sugar isomerase domain-containing protein [Erysipelotrichaceae bacterium]